MRWDKLYSVATEFKDSKASMQEDLIALKKDNQYGDKKLINQGSMKVIFQCEDHATGRMVAYATPKSSEPKMVENFLREAKLTSSLQHPNIVPVYDVGNDGGNVYFVMKLIQGKSLANLLFQAESPIKLPKLLGIFTKICEAVSYAHSRGVIHLDLKPDNVRVSDHGEVLLCDWGIAKIIHWNSSDQENLLKDPAFSKADIQQATLSGYVKGTPGYLSPEQARGGAVIKNTKSDIYSLGVILYEILCREHPINEENIEDILSKTIKGQFTAPRSRCPKVPVSLEAICIKAMALNPAERYASVDDLLNDLELYQAGYAPKAESPSFLKKITLLIRRNPLFFSSVFVFTALLSLTFIYSTLKLNKTNKELSLAKNESASLAVKAQRHLKESKESRRELNRIAKVASKEYLERANRYFIRINYEQSLYHCEMAQKLNPDNEWPHYLRSQIALANLDIEGAQIAFSKVNKAAGKLKKSTDRIRLQKAIQLLEEFNNQSVKKPEEKVLYFVALIKKLRDLKLVVLSHFMIKTFMQNDANADSRLKALTPLLKLFNPLQKAWNVHYRITDQGLFLDLSGNSELRDLSPLFGLKIHNIKLNGIGRGNINVLKFSDLKELSMTDSGFVGFKEFNLKELQTFLLDDNKIKRFDFLRNSSIETLSLRHVKVENFYFLKDMPKLKKLILHRIPESLPKKFHPITEIIP